MALSMIELTTGASTGGAGASTAAATTANPISGVILAVYIKYTGSPPATTDVVIKTTGTGSGAPPSLTFLTVSNANTDAWFYPRVPEHLSTTGAAITDSYDWPVVVNDTLTVTASQMDDGDSVKIWVQFEAN